MIIGTIYKRLNLCRSLHLRFGIVSLDNLEPLEAEAMADYPDNSPDLTAKEIDSSKGYIVALDPGQVAKIVGSFQGRDTGCAVYLNDLTTGYQVYKMVHHLDVSPENFQTSVRAPLDAPSSYLLSVWTFIGGLPHVERPEGCDQDAPSGVSQSHVATGIDFTCQGSSHGSTNVSITVSVL